MIWDELQEEIQNELEEIGVTSDIDFSDTVLEERTDRPVLVRDGVLNISRPVKDFSEDEQELVKWGAVSDILAYEAGLSSPGTFSQSDWDEFEALYGELEKGELRDFVPGSDDLQERRNGSLLMREKGEKIREYGKNLQKRTDTAEDYAMDVLEVLFGPDKQLFDSDTPPEYYSLIELVQDATRRIGSYEEIAEKTRNLEDHPQITAEGEETISTLRERLPELDVADQIAKDAIQRAKGQVESEYQDLLDDYDEKMMAASLLYRSVSLGGSEQLKAGNRQISNNLNGLDYVTNSTLEQTEYLRDMAAEKHFSKDMNLESAFNESVREFLSDDYL